MSNSHVLKIFCLFVISIVAFSCVEDSTDESDTTTTTLPETTTTSTTTTTTTTTLLLHLSGLLFDGPIVGANITIIGHNGVELAKTESKEEGKFNIDIVLKDTSNLSKPIYLQSEGGVDIGADSILDEAYDHVAISLQSVFILEKENFLGSVASTEVPITPISTILAKKVASVSATQTVPLTPSDVHFMKNLVSGQLGISIEELSKKPTSDPQTAQVSLSLGLLTKLIDIVNADSSLASSFITDEFVFNNVSETDQAWFTISPGSEGLKFRETDFLTHLKEKSGLDDTAFFPTKLVFDLGESPIRRLAQQVANQMDAVNKQDDNPNISKIEERAIETQHFGTKSLMNSAELLKDLIKQGTLSKGKLKVITQALKFAVNEKITNLSQRSILELDSPEVKSVFSKDDGENLVSYFDILFLQNDSIASQTEKSFLDETMETNGLLDLQNKALTKLVVLINSKNSEWATRAKEAGSDLREIQEILSNLIKIIITTDYVDDLKQNTILSNELDTTIAIETAAAIIASEAYHFLENSLNTAQRFIDLQVALTNEGMMVENIRKVSQQATKTFLSKVIELKNSNASRDIFNNPSSSAGVIEKVNLAEQFSESELFEISIADEDLTTRSDSYAENIETQGENAIVIMQEDAVYISSERNNVPCVSEASGGNLLGEGGDVFGDTRCGFRDNNFSISAENDIEWNGENGPLLGNVTILPEGRLTLTNTEGVSPVIFGNIILAGGTLSIKEDVVVSGSLIIQEGSTINIESKGEIAKTLHMNGPAINVGKHEITITGGGVLQNYHPIILDQADSKLVLEAGSTINKLLLDGDTLPSASLQIKDNVSINELVLSRSLTVTALDSIPNAHLNINTLIIQKESQFTTSLDFSLEKLVLYQSLDFVDKSPLTSAATLEVNDNSTLTFKGNLDFSEEFKLEETKTFIIDSNSEGTILVNKENIDIKGNIVRSTNGKLEFDDDPILDVYLTYQSQGPSYPNDTVGPFFPGDTLVLNIEFDWDVRNSPVPTLSTTGANTNTGLVLLENSTTQYSYNYVVKPGSGLVNFKINAIGILGNTAQVTQTNVPSFIINNRPSALQVSNQSVFENAPIGTIVGEIISFDIDKDPLEYKLTTNKNTDNTFFRIENRLDNELESWLLVTNQVFNREEISTRLVEIEVNDFKKGILVKPFDIEILDVDEEPPQVILVSSTTPDAHYNAGKIIDITVKFDEIVFVTNSNIRMDLDVGLSGNEGTAIYIENGGTDTLTLQYLVREQDNAEDLNYINENALIFEPGAILDAHGNPASAVLPSIGSENSLAETKDIVIDTKKPQLTETSAVQDGANDATPSYSFFSTESGNISFGGGCIGAEPKDYFAKAGPNTIDFSFTEDVETTHNCEIRVTDSANNQSEVLEVKEFTIVLTDAEVASVKSGAGKFYNETDEVEINVFFNEIISIDTNGGSPRLKLCVGTESRYATFSRHVDEILTFVYDVQPGDNSNDLAYCGTNSLEIGGAIIKNVSENDALLTLPTPGTPSSLSGGFDVVIDTIKPILTNGSTIPSPTTDRTPNFSFSSSERGVIAFQGGCFSEMTNTPPLDGGSDSVVTNLTIKHKSEDGNFVELLDGLYECSVTVTDDARNISAPLVIAPFVVDGTGPQVDLVFSTTGDGYYRIAEEIFINVQFNETIIIATTGTPKIEMETGVNDRPALFHSFDGDKTLIFKYTVQNNDESNDLSYRSEDALIMEEMVLEDAAKNIANKKLPLPGTDNALDSTQDIVIDTKDPGIQSVSVPPFKTYGLGESLEFSVNFDSEVAVTGIPQLFFNIGEFSKKADYFSQEGRNINFKYTIIANDNDSNGIFIQTLLFDNGNITDLAGNQAPEVLNNVGATNGVLVDTSSPDVTSTSGPISGTYTTGDILRFTFTFDEPIVVSGTPAFELILDNATRNASYNAGATSNNQMLFSYQLQEGDLDTDGVTFGSVILGEGGKVADAVGNEWGLIFPKASLSTEIFVSSGQ